MKCNSQWLFLFTERSLTHRRFRIGTTDSKQIIDWNKTINWFIERKFSCIYGATKRLTRDTQTRVFHLRVSNSASIFARTTLVFIYKGNTHAKHNGTDVQGEELSKAMWTVSLLNFTLKDSVPLYLQETDKKGEVTQNKCLQMAHCILTVWLRQSRQHFYIYFHVSFAPLGYTILDRIVLFFSSKV